MNCVYRDEILIDGEDDVHVQFFDEHSHPESEIRYVAEGSCYFDLHTPQDDWVRILCEEGDLLVLPPGVSHRFTTTEKVGGVGGEGLSKFKIGCRLLKTRFPALPGHHQSPRADPMNGFRSICT
jgi:hypothetical protein